MSKFVGSFFFFSSRKTVVEWRRNLTSWEGTGGGIKWVYTDARIFISRFSFHSHTFHSPPTPSPYNHLISTHWYTPHTLHTHPHTHTIAIWHRRGGGERRKEKKKGIWPKRANEEYNFLLYFVRTQFLFLFFLIICFEIMIICV